jgi:hypothetical protein
MTKKEVLSAVAQGHTVFFEDELGVTMEVYFGTESGNVFLFDRNGDYIFRRGMQSFCDDVLANKRNTNWRIYR